MSKINKLPETVIRKIAAGQVVEGPHSVVKELIENSLDAKSTNITIRLFKKGIRSIEVFDDGTGIAKGDLIKSILPYTTSKISSENDLHSIDSYGFRGEALSSIATVSRLTIRSRTSKGNGHQIIVRNGNVISETPIGMKRGTLVRVDSLFSTTPARHKALGSGVSEYKKILETIYSFAIAHEDKTFCVYSDDNRIFLLKPQEKLKRVTTLFGKSVSDNVLHISNKSRNYSINGYIGHPLLATQKSDQYIFVNERCVKLNSLSQSMKSLYKELIDPRTRPFFILFIKTHPSLIDPNIDPKKENVKLLHENELLDILENTVKTTFKNKNLAYKYKTPLFKGASKHTYSFLKDSTSVWDSRVVRLSDHAKVMFIHEMYAVIQCDDGIVLLDPHAAHERILYNQYIKAFKEKSSKKEKLQNPIVITFNYKDYLNFENARDSLIETGFEISDFGERTIKIEKIPLVFKNRDISLLIRELIESNETIDIKSLETIAYLACRGALKQGEMLTSKEIVELLNKLLKENNNITCPHGRPTRIEINKRDLDKLFKRH